MTEPDIDALLRQDEAALREKRKRLKAFAAALSEVRQANEKASTLVSDLLAAGDITKADLVKSLGLTPRERAALVPASRRTSETDAERQSASAAEGREN